MSFYSTIILTLTSYDSVSTVYNDSTLNSSFSLTPYAYATCTFPSLNTYSVANGTNYIELGVNLQNVGNETYKMGY